MIDCSIMIGQAAITDSPRGSITYVIIYEQMCEYICCSVIESPCFWVQQLTKNVLGAKLFCIKSV